MHTRTVLRILFSLSCVKYIFFWCFGSRKKPKGITSAMECVDVANFTFATWQIRSCFFCCHVETPRPPLGRIKDFRESREQRCLFAKSFWNMDTRTVLGIFFSLLSVKYIFFWWSTRNSKGIIKTLEKYYVSHGICWPCNFHFCYVTDKILSTLQVFFARSLSRKFSEYYSQF